MAFWSEKYALVPGAQLALDSCLWKVTRSVLLSTKKGATVEVMSLEDSFRFQGKFPSSLERNQKGRTGILWKRTQEENA